MPYKYSYQGKEENIAKAVGSSLSISTKHAILICNMLRGKPVSTALDMLEKVQEKKLAVAHTRFGGGVGHKPGMGPGRYPLKASKEIATVLKSAQANAQSKGLSTNDLIIESIVANRASIPLRYGRKGGVSAKRTHIEIVLKEKAKKESNKKVKVPLKKEGAKK